MCQGFPRWLKDYKHSCDRENYVDSWKCQSSWKFHGELVQLQITVIVLSLLGEGQHSSWWGESFPWLCSTSWPAACVWCSQFICMQWVWCFFEVLHLSCTFSLLCLQRSSNSVSCIYHAHSVYSVYSDPPTQLLLRLPRLLKVIFYTGILMLKCLPLLLLHTTPVSF